VKGVLLYVASATVLLLAGGFPLRHPVARVVGRLPGAVLVGGVWLHLVLTLASQVGIRWSAGLLAFAVVSGWTGCRLWAGRAPVELAGADPKRRIGWGLVAGSIPIAWFGFLSAVHLAHTPDFVYHWGLKAARWVAARGIDEGFLSRPGAWRMHPDYPQLVTELGALPGLLSGEFDERAALLQAAAVAWLTLLVIRRSLSDAGVVGFALEAWSTVVGAALGGFGAAHGMAGGADGFVAFAVAVAMAGLLRPASEATGLAAIGWGAAFAAGSKIEGIPIAAILLLAAAWQRRRERRGFADAILAALPAGSVAAVWWWGAMDLLLPTNAGPPRLGTVPEVLAGIARAALSPDGGLFPVLLLALPWAAREPRLRLPAGVVASVVGLYFVLYIVSPVGGALLVQLSAQRLLSQITPALLLILSARSGSVLHRDSSDGLGGAERNGIRLLPERQDAGAVTPEVVRILLDEAD